MANVQCENGYTKIANELLEALLKYKFPSNTDGVPLKLCLFVIRKTYGYGKTQDKISLTQFEKGVNSTRPTICHWLDYLVKALLLVKEVKPVNNTVLYSINKDYDQWIPLVKALLLVKGRNRTSLSPLTETSLSPLTHKRKKEILQKKEEEEDFHQKTLIISKRLDIKPTKTLDEYIRKYADKELKPLVDNLIQWCSEKKIKPTGLRLMNWLRKEFK